MQQAQELSRKARLKLHESTHQSCKCQNNAGTRGLSDQATVQENIIVQACTRKWLVGPGLTKHGFVKRLVGLWGKHSGHRVNLGLKPILGCIGSSTAHGASCGNDTKRPQRHCYPCIRTSAPVEPSGPQATSFARKVRPQHHERKIQPHHCCKAIACWVLECHCRFTPRTYVATREVTGGSPCQSTSTQVCMSSEWCFSASFNFDDKSTLAQSHTRTRHKGPHT